MIDLISDATRPREDYAVLKDFSPSLVKALGKSAIDRNLRLTDELQRTLADQKVATTEIGEDELTSSFKLVQDSPKRGASLWTASVICLVVLGLFAPFIAFWLDPKDLHELSNVSSLLIKALSGLPLYALAAYCGHIAAQHRETERHLEILNAQIKSVRAYTTNMPEEQRLEIRVALGLRAFTDPGFKKHDDGNVTVVRSGTVELVKQIRELVEKAKTP